ncbi:branched-chain amino acid ABC transporter permease [Salinirubellus salinus]|uniref:Branched-chain amino acid ABC transporter permease n=1 Tax=Salinirubellus salinus TaxID=1364945 RepID=A0A9E7U635_9EURY|nr:branched-chain amino acid ABC transporter permease [Salinirubellus salinus]UWM56070.1 branched-chain amino acid ABC transporter permease [Salinirubellus salinus]
MSAQSAGLTDRVRNLLVDVFGGNDARMIAGTMGGIYLLLIVFSLVAGFGLGGIVNTLRAATVFAAGYGMLVLALNLHWGYTGLFNIGVAGFMAVGTYTTAILSAPPEASPGAGLGLPIPIAILGGMFAAALVGLLTALPALRLRADYLAIVTVALSEIIRLAVKSGTLAEFTIFGVTLGTGGGRGISYPAPGSLGGWVLDNVPGGEALVDVGQALGIAKPVMSGLVYLVVLILFAAAFYWLLVRIGNSPFGRVLKAIREDELVASSLGKDTRVFKLKVFAVGCALMGLAGYLWIGRSGFVNDLSFRPNITFFIFIALIIGGAGSNTGALLGGMVFSSLLFYLPQFLSQNFGSSGSAPGDFLGALAGLDEFVAYTLQNISSLRFVLIGVLLVYLMHNRPDGLLGHRKEDAAAVNLLERSSKPPGSGATVADGGEGGERDE